MPAEERTLCRNTVHEGQTCKDGFSCRSLKTMASQLFNLEAQSKMQLPECLGVPLINISGSSLALLYWAEYSREISTTGDGRKVGEILCISILWPDRKQYWKRKIEVFLNSLIIYLVFEALSGSRKWHLWATVFLKWVPFHLKELMRHRPTLSTMFEAGLFFSPDWHCLAFVLHQQWWELFSFSRLWWPATLRCRGSDTWRDSYSSMDTGATPDWPTWCYIFSTRTQ